MKQKIFYLLTAGVLTLATAKTFAQADVQIIHNAADPAAAVVDIYVDGNLALDDFAFRSATPFISLPSGVAINVGVAAGNSTSVNDTLKNFELTLAQGGRYVAIANGVLTPVNFASNPDGKATAFNLYIKDNVEASAMMPTDVDFFALHGATDAPTVDVIARNVATLVDDAAYGDITGYVTVPAASYILDVTPGSNNSTIVASYQADLSSLGGGAAVVFASGFLNPANNQNGAAFGLFAALPNGTVVTFPQIAQARLQVIHNAADPAAALVDVYVNGNLLLDDFAFRAATPYIDVPADVELNIGIAASTSTSVNDTLVNIPVTLSNGGSYLAIANGVLNPANFAANPNARPIGFQLLAASNTREASLNGTDVDFIALHGATDAPTVDVIARNVATLVNDAAYGDITGYVTVPAASYILDVTPGSNNSTIVASYQADLSSLGGGAALVFASGFLNPANNQNGAAFGLFAALPNGTVVTFPQIAQARLQVIHNAADPAAALVDVYVNGNLLLDDFAFRAATPYIDVPADVELNIGIAGSASTSVNDTLVNIPVTLMNGGSYVAIANGVLNPANFAANPDARPIGFQLLAAANTREASLNGTDVDFIAVHGATDAPTVDVIARNVATLVNDAAYGDITGYVTVPAASYILDVTPGSNNATIVASYQADLSSLGGGAAVVFASGFLNPANNQNGAAFGLFAALPNGTVVTFPQIAQARLQVIHNAADPAAALVDVYVNGNLLLDDFAFRAATPYIDVPADVELNIGIAASTSTSVNDTLVNIPVTLSNGGSYVAIANGVLNPANFAANPDARPIGFQLLAAANTREASLNGTDVDFIALHGATDAPTVDVIARNVATLVNDAAYGDITGYVTVPAASYILDVTPGSNNSTIVASYQADLSSLGGGAAVVFASGFLNPANNQNGAAFGLFAALPNGTVIQFPAYLEARLQVIHNAADPAASLVDVYVNGGLFLDDFAFRTATPFVSVPAGVNLNIGVAPSTSTSVNDTIKNFEVTLAAGSKYVAVANGVLNPATFAVNPDGQSTAFTLFVNAAAQETGNVPANFDFAVLHGSTDAPTVDVIARSVATLVDDATYSAFTTYLSVPASTYLIDITPGNNNSVIVATFAADLTTLAGNAGVVFASGFLTPANNQNGVAFGLFVALPNGTVIPLSNVTSIEEFTNLISGIYPNPATDGLVNVQLQNTNSNDVTVSVVNQIGQEVYNTKVRSGIQKVQLNTENLTPGIYFVKIQNGSSTDSKKLIKY